jgi:hypothetical protein
VDQGICCSCTLWAIPSPSEKENLKWSKDRESTCSMLFIEDEKMNYGAKVDLDLLEPISEDSYSKKGNQFEFCVINSFKNFLTNNVLYIYHAKSF